MMGHFSSDLGNFGSLTKMSKETHLWKWGIFEGFSNFRATHLSTLERRRTQQHERPVSDKHNKWGVVTKVYF